jgi:hypothetical protein
MFTSCEDAIDFYEKAIELCRYFEELKPGQSITAYLADLKIYIEMYGFEWTKEALQKTISNKGKFIKPYMEQILKNWQSEGKSDIKKGDKQDGTGKQHIESPDREGIGIEI